MEYIVPAAIVLLFLAIRKYYKWKAKRANERRKRELKEEIDRLLEVDEFEDAISN